jgi:hypothetical protein
MIFFAKPVLTDDLYIMQTEEFLITCCMCDTYTWQRQAKHIHKRQTHLFVREDIRTITANGSVEKNSGRESKGLTQNELIGGKPPVVN